MLLVLGRRRLRLRVIIAPGNLAGVVFARGDAVAPVVLETVQTHRGMSDASAAIPLKDGRFLVASDEENIFQVFNSTASGLFEQEIDFSHFLNNRHKSHEADIEACAQLNGMVFWLGSHGRSAAGEMKWSRHQLFCTKVFDQNDAVVVKQIGISYSGLLVDLLQCQWFRKLTTERLDPTVDGGLAPKVLGAVNIEGLTSFGEGQLLIGFRNPIPKNKALLVPFLNPLDVVMHGAHAIFGEPITLDLNGRGVRSIDFLAGAKFIHCGEWLFRHNKRF